MTNKFIPPALAVALLAVSVAPTSLLSAADKKADGLGQGLLSVKPDYGKSVEPFLKKYCISCHGGKEPTSNLGV